MTHKPVRYKFEGMVLENGNLAAPRNPHTGQYRVISDVDMMKSGLNHFPIGQKLGVEVFLRHRVPVFHYNSHGWNTFTNIQSLRLISSEPSK